jgi:dipeptidyl aminopeptidase/acylaminoacyl peptidase
MLLGYHYMQFYHWAYGINQWLADQGYVVLSVNYRSGIGYGRSFRTAPNTGGRGNAEYQDVLTGGKYLQSRPDVDPDRVGIWGLSYGGVLTGQALARNSDIFKAGVDLAGVHLWGSSLDPESVSFKSSVVGAIDGWKSPVLLVHGDDDRNVAFQQTTGLVQLLRQRDSTTSYRLSGRHPRVDAVQPLAAAWTDGAVLQSSWAGRRDDDAVMRLLAWRERLACAGGSD